MKEKITYKKACDANRVIKNQLTEITDDLAIQIYFIRTSVSEAFTGHDELQEEKAKEISNIHSSYDKGEQISKEHRERINKIQEEMSDLYRKEEDVELKRGKINISDLRNVEKDNVEILSALDFAIDFTPKEKPKKEAKDEAA